MEDTKITLDDFKKALKSEKVKFDSFEIVDTSTVNVLLDGEVVDTIDLETAVRNEIDRIIEGGFYEEVKQG